MSITAQDAMHTHLFRVTAGEQAVRWCETCGKAWILLEYRDILDKKYFARKVRNSRVRWLGQPRSASVTMQPCHFCNSRSEW